jgi:hypothetical protein
MKKESLTNISLFDELSNRIMRFCFKMMKTGSWIQLLNTCRSELAAADTIPAGFLMQLCRGSS